MANRPKQHHISVSGACYARLKAFTDQHGVTQASVVEAAVAPAIGLPIQPLRSREKR